jgi:hypothetical protein
MRKLPPLILLLRGPDCSGTYTGERATPAELCPGRGTGRMRFRHFQHIDWGGTRLCKNVALGASTALSDLLAKAAAGTPDPKWDFEPENLTINQW